MARFYDATGPTGPTGAQPSLSSTTPLIDGTASAGSSTSASRSDHVHPSNVVITNGGAITRFVGNYLNNVGGAVGARASTEVVGSLGVAVSPIDGSLYLANVNTANAIIKFEPTLRTSTVFNATDTFINLAINPVNGDMYACGLQYLCSINKTTGVKTQIAAFGGVTFLGMAISPDGTTLIIADYGQNVLRAYNTATGQFSIFAGTLGSSGNTGDGGPATSATLSQPTDCAWDRFGNVYVSCGSGYIRKIDTSGIITSIYAPGSVAPTDNNRWINSTPYLNSYCYGVTVLGDYIYTIRQDNRLVRMPLSGGLVTVVGGTGSSTLTDGVLSAAGIPTDPYYALTAFPENCGNPRLANTIMYSGYYQSFVRWISP